MKLALQGAGVSTGHVRNMRGIATGLAMITVSENDNTIVVVPRRQYAGCQLRKKLRESWLKRPAFLLCIEKIGALDIFQFFCSQAERGDQLLIFWQRSLRDNNFHGNILIEIADR